MKKKPLYIFLSAIILCGIIYVFGRFEENYKYKKKAQKLIFEIERYKEKHKLLPDSVEDIKDTLFINEQGEGPYYNKINDSLYEVYYNVGFDNLQFVYNVVDKKWVWRR